MKNAIQGLLQVSASKLEPELAKDAVVDNEIELCLNVD